MKTELGILHCVLSMLLCAALVGCRGSDVVMYDARSEDVVWGSVGTDSDWRECLSLAVDGFDIKVISLDDLIVNKRASGRPKDVADALSLDELNRIGRLAAGNSESRLNRLAVCCR